MRQYKVYEPKGSDALELEDAEKPTIKTPTQVLVKVHAVSLNARENQFVDGTYVFQIPKGGVVPTSDAAGEVVGVGSKVRQHKVGDRVTPGQVPGHHYSEYFPQSSIETSPGFVTDGYASEYIVVDQEDLIKIPSHMTYEEAATLPIACGTAWNCLYGATKKIQAGDTVVCMGTGGVSVFAAAITLMAGGRVIMTSSSDAKVDEVRKHLSKLITSDQSFQSINRKTHKETDKEIARLTDGKLADFLIEIGGVATLPASIRSVKQGGLLALVGILSSQAGDEAPREDFAKLMLYHGCIARQITCCNREQAKQMNSAFELSQYKPLINKTFEFDQMKDAFAYSVSGDHIGKIVIKVTSA